MSSVAVPCHPRPLLSPSFIAQRACPGPQLLAEESSVHSPGGTVDFRGLQLIGRRFEFLRSPQRWVPSTSAGWSEKHHPR